MTSGNDSEPVAGLRAETEAESLLGPDVKVPHGIPKDYHPSDVSTHPLFRIALSDFEGPLDLLLYLIRKHDLDILDIPIAFITEQYLKMIKDLDALPVDVAAEFLVMAAELAHIKSKMLLPVKEGVVVESEEEILETDPRSDLVKRLLEYQKYQDAAHQLDDRDQLGRDVFVRTVAGDDAIDDLDPGLRHVSVFKLVELMAEFVKKESKGRHEIVQDPIKISDRIQYIVAFADARDGRFPFIQLLDTISSRNELVITFIAILEMIRSKLLRLSLAPLVKRDARAGVEGEPLETASELEETTVWLEATGRKMEGLQIVDDYL